MSIETKGEEVGKIQLHLPALGVANDRWGSLEKKISRFKNVVSATVSPGGWLTARTDVTKFKIGDDLVAVLTELEERITRSCQATTGRVRV